MKKIQNNPEEIKSRHIPQLSVGMKIFILLVWGTLLAVACCPLANKVHADDGNPREILYSQDHYLQVKDTDLMVYLLKQEDAEYLPEIIPFRITCYSSGRSELFVDEHYTEAAGYFTNEGRVKLYMALLNFTLELCTYIGDSYESAFKREGGYARHL